jgi:membrane associated rhomboid family serine protease
MKSELRYTASSRGARTAVFPYKDDNPTLRRPVITYCIIATNLAIWFFVQGAGTEPAISRSICDLGLIPREILGAATAGESFELGPHTVCALQGDPPWHTLVTSMFMHGGWAHILGNLWFLWIFGNNVEDAMGRIRFVVFYLLCGVAAAGAQVAAMPASAIPMVGASGAIGGVMGAYVVLYPRVRVHLLVILGIFITTITIPAYFMLGYWVLLQILGTMLDVEGAGVAFWAHLGGFGAGVVLIWLFKNERLVETHRRALSYATGFRGE